MLVKGQIVCCFELCVENIPTLCLSIDKQPLHVYIYIFNIVKSMGIFCPLRSG